MHCRRLLLSIFVVLLILDAVIVSSVEARDKTAAASAYQFISLQKKNTAVSNQVDYYAIGCVLPLTGRNASAGNKALEAVILAAGLFDKYKKSPFKLVIEDSKSEPDAAKAAVSKLAQEKVLCIIGPLGNAEALAAAGEAQRLKVPIITLTQKERITDTGDYVFRNYMTNEMQIRALVAYAVYEMDLNRFAVLYPDDHYGREMERLFRYEVLRQKIKTIKSKSYDKTHVDFGDVLKAISYSKGISSGREEIEKAQSEQKPAVDFDALFIPDTPARISMIIPQLAYYNVRGVKLLGTNIWNSADLLKTAGGYVEGAVFPDSFCLNTFYPEANDFIDIFYKHYGREPDVLAALVYDAARMILKIVEENDVESREHFKKSLLKLKNYRGATGTTSFSGKRDAHKNLFILTVKDGQIIQIK
jgi:ABC-type branched-subunit amino acid transport system substrate-binding protein